MTARQSPEIDAVSLECLNLLTVYYTYRESIQTCCSAADTRLDLTRRWITLRVLENDLIMRLCRLDDDSKTNHSLREALRSVRNEMPNNQAARLDKHLKGYRRLINPLKTKSRNYFIAHLDKAAEAPFDPKGGLEEPIELAINIADEIAGAPLQYILKVGSQERVLNLKEELSRGS